MLKGRLRNSITSIMVLLAGVLQGQGSTIAEGFFDQEVKSGYTLPIGITFDSEGNAYVREKAGRVYAVNPYTGEQTMILDVSEEVASWGDHGFTGFAFDPDFQENGFVYAAYAVDRYHLLNFGTSEYEQDSSILTNATIGRVSRFTFDLNQNPIKYIPDSRKVLLGKSLTDGFPILADLHGVGSLAFGEDGSLLVSCGDAGLDAEPNVVYHTGQALKDGIIDSTMVIGSYRSQSLHSTNGKLLRINKETGDGLASNPFYMAEEPRSPQSRIWSIGFRNPYKFMHMPGTGSHNPALGNPGKFIVGDVGSAWWEEFNLVTEAGQNFGWPVYEGHSGAWPYGWYEIENIHAPNPYYNGSTCDRKFFWYNELIIQENASGNYELGIPCEGINDKVPSSIPTFMHTRPFIHYSNVKWNTPKRSFVPDFDVDGEAIEVPSDKKIEGYSALPGAWYEEGSLPDSFYNSLIVSDFSGWVKAFKFNENDELVKILNIREDISGIVDVTLNPIDDCLYYVNVFTGQLRKICFGGNPAPIAVIDADTIFGGNELTVNFDASQSYDPNQLPISLSWDFGDGETSDLEQLEHTFKTNGSLPEKYRVILSVVDSLGAIGLDSIDISLNNTPPSVDIISPVQGSKYAINGYNRMDFEANVLDKEENEEDLSFTWQVHLHHNLHYHSEEPIFKTKYSALLEPIGCAEKDEYWYRVSLHVSDSYGLSASDELLIYPNCDEYSEATWERYSSKGNNILLNWEMNGPADNFTVQKIDDAGNISDLGSTRDKQFDDKNPINGNNRYRLKIFRQGNYFYSTEKTIEFPIRSLAVYPNPNSIGKLNIHLDQHLGEDVEVSIYSISGAKVFEKTFTGLKGEHFDREISIDQLSKGVYVLQLSNGERLLREKFEVVR